MAFCGMKKGKNSPDTRGLSDHHPHPSYVSSPASLVPSPNLASPPMSSSFSVPASSSFPIATPYVPPQQVVSSKSLEVKFVAGGNENEGGEQEVEVVEVGNGANGVVSPIFTVDGGKFDITVGNNKNKGGNQKIGGVKFGNAA